MRLGGLAVVPVMESADLWGLDDSPGRASLITVGFPPCGMSSCGLVIIQLRIAVRPSDD